MRPDLRFRRHAQYRPFSQFPVLDAIIATREKDVISSKFTSFGAPIHPSAWKRVSEAPLPLVILLKCVSRQEGTTMDAICVAV